MLLGGCDWLKQRPEWSLHCAEADIACCTLAGEVLDIWYWAGRCLETHCRCWYSIGATLAG